MGRADRARRERHSRLRSFRPRRAAAAFLLLALGALAAERPAMAQAVQVGIEAEHDTIGAGVNDLNFTLTRTGATTDSLEVTVTLEQDENWLTDSNLTHTVTFGVDKDEATLTVSAIRFSFQPSQPGDLTATVSGTGISGGTVTVGVVSTPDPPITLTFDNTSYAIAENADPAGVVINLVATLDTAYPLPPTTATLPMTSLSTRAGTASPPIDYVAVSWQFTLSDYTFERSVDTDPYKATVPVQDGGFKIRDDATDEPNQETFSLLIERTGGVIPGSILFRKADGSTCVLFATGCGQIYWPVTIIDDDAPPELAFEVAPTEIAEADDAATDAEENVATVTVTSTNGKMFRHDQTLTLTFGGTATYGTHYTVEPPDADAVAPGHQLTYPGEASVIQAIEDAELPLADHLPLEAPVLEVTVRAFDNRVADGDRTVQVSAAHGATALGGAQTVTIADVGVLPAPVWSATLTVGETAETAGEGRGYNSNITDTGSLDNDSFEAETTDDGGATSGGSIPSRWVLLSSAIGGH